MSREEARRNAEFDFVMRLADALKDEARIYVSARREMWHSDFVNLASTATIWIKGEGRAALLDALGLREMWFADAPDLGLHEWDSSGCKYGCVAVFVEVDGDS